MFVDVVVNVLLFKTQEKYQDAESGFGACRCVAGRDYQTNVFQVHFCSRFKNDKNLKYSVLSGAYVVSL